MNPRDPRITGPGGHSDPASSRFQPGKALLFPPSITERVTIGERIVFMAFIEARGYAIGKKPSCSVAFSPRSSPKLCHVSACEGSRRRTDLKSDFAFEPLRNKVFLLLRTTSHF